MSTLGERLKILRKGQTQAWLAKQLGIPATTLSNYENGKSELNFATIDAITSIFEVNTDWLIFGRGPMTQERSQESNAREISMCPHCLNLEKRLEISEGERRQASERLVETLQANVALTAENGQLRLENVKLTQHLETARQMCREYSAALKEAGGADPLFEERQIIPPSDANLLR